MRRKLIYKRVVLILFSTTITLILFSTLLYRNFDEEEIYTQRDGVMLENDLLTYSSYPLLNLTKFIQNRIVHLQNPESCSNSRILIWDWTWDCGFGCLIHNAAFCLIVAAATNRTLLLEGDGHNWPFRKELSKRLFSSKIGWESLFLPISKCRYSESVSFLERNFLVKPYKFVESSARVVRCTGFIGVNKNLHPKTSPLAFPKEISDLLLAQHKDPPVFFIGQFIWYLMQHNNVFKQFLSKSKQDLPFEKSPIVGIHIRRTDKIKEAKYHNIEEYMKWVDIWFKNYEPNRKSKFQRQIYIATDNSSVIEEIKLKYPTYKIFTELSRIETAQLEFRHTIESLYGIVIDIRILSMCDYVVCTFSSNACRVVYELMQVLHGDATHMVFSLDDIYFYTHQQDHEEVVINSHKSQSYNQIDLNVGDVIRIEENFWNGFCNGTNSRTRTKGIYPCNKTKEKWRIESFPLFDS